jgi:SPP1 gp7 family putative phage head morphogenesis protein
MPANDDIRDDLVRHRVELQRFSNGLAARMRAILNRAEPALRAKLKARLEREVGFQGYTNFGNPVTATLTTKRYLGIARFIESLNEPVFAEVSQLVRTELTQLSKVEAATAHAIMTGNLPVVTNLSLPDARALRSIVYARPMQKRILRDWLSSYSTNDRRRMMDEIRQGLAFSETPTQISRRIFGTQALGGTDGVREITRRGAQTLAQTTSAAILNGALAALYEANKNVIKKEIYTATLDSRTTPICRALDGNLYNINEGPHPPIHLNCRSIRVPAIDGKRIGVRPANATTERNLRGLRGPARRRAVEKLVGQVPAETTYQQWLGRQSVAFQNEVLGPTRGVLFRKGGLQLDRFVDGSGNQYTLPELWEREQAAFRRAGLTPNLVPGL